MHIVCIMISYTMIALGFFVLTGNLICKFIRKLEIKSPCENIKSPCENIKSSCENIKSSCEKIRD